MALPMGFNRQPHYARGLLLVGDSGGMVNPFNGEGIDYALEAGALAGDRIDAALAQTRAAAPRGASCTATPTDLKAHYGGYYTLGRWFVTRDRASVGDEAGHDLRHAGPGAAPAGAEADGQPHRHPPSRTRMDRLVNSLSRIAPAPDATAAAPVPVDRSEH